jgi:hypothetical protein
MTEGVACPHVGEHKCLVCDPEYQFPSGYDKPRPGPTWTSTNICYEPPTTKGA